MKFFLIIAFALFCIQGNAQKKSSKTDTISFTVSGVCIMCEERIETALDVVGVKSAEWEKETQLLQVEFNPNKLTIDDLHRLLAKAGHKTDKVQADPKAYNALPGCCKYDDGVKVH